MKKLEGKRNHLLENIILIASIGVLAGVLAICVFMNSAIATTNKLIYGAVAFLVVVGLYAFFWSIKEYLAKIPSKYVYCGTIFVFLMLTFVSIVVRNKPITDYEMVYNAALQYVQGEEVNWAYFSRWPNNYFLFWLLALGGKLSNFLGVQDSFYVLVTINALATSITMLCVFKIIEFYEPQKHYLKYFGATLMLVFIPLWGGTQCIYSDSTSILFGVLAIFCCLKGREHKSVWFFVGAGIATAIGLLLKPTTCVCFIAFVIVENVFYYKKGLWKKYVVLCGVVMCVVLAFSAVKANAPYHKYDFQYKAPFQFWFALGLQGNGKFADNLEFAEMCLNSKTYEERVEVANNIIKKEARNLFLWEHIHQKTLANFGNGTFGLYDFQYHVGLGYMLFNPFGRFGGYTSNFSTMYFWLILFLATLAGIMMLFDKKKIRPLLIWLFGFFGIAVFLMLWEANNRQLYNQIPLLALMGCFSVDYLYNKVRLFLKKEEIHGKK